MLSTERKLFVSRVSQRVYINHDDLPPDTVPIRFRFFKLTGRGSCRLGALTAIAYDEPILLGEDRGGLQDVPRKYVGPKFKSFVTRKLSRLDVPDEKQAAIFRKLARLVMMAVPWLPISVTIVEVTVRLNPIGMAMCLFCRVTSTGEDVDYGVIVDTVSWEFMETYVWQIKYTPATKSSIEAFEKLRLDSLEEETIRQFSPCAICLEQLDHHFDTDVAAGGILVTRLPCLHLFHRDCIVLWLEKSHFCPLCQYQMPTAVRVEGSDIPANLQNPHGS